VIVARRGSLRDGIGGRRLLDRRVLIWLLPTSLLTSVLTRDPEDLRTTLAWVGVNLASLTLVWLWIELLRAVVVNGPVQRPAPVGLVVLIGASVGFVKATTTSLFAWTASLLPALMPAAEWWRASGTTLQGAFLLPLVTLAVATLDRSRDEYDRLVAERARIALLDVGGGSGRAADVERARLIAGFVRDARARLTGAQEGDDVAGVLERLVDERLRPMTRELWSPEAIATDFRARSLLRAALTANPFPASLVIIAYSVTAFASRAQHLDLGTNVLRTLAAVASLTVVLTLARRFRPAGPRLAVAHLVLTVAVASALQTFLVEAIGTDGLDWRPASLFLSVFVWLGALTVLGGAGVVAARGSDAVRAELERTLRSGGPHAEVERASQLLRDRAVADHLHATLQNRLISASHRIAASGEQPSVVREELDAVELLLDDLASGVLGESRDGSCAREQFAEVVARWDGFVHITAALDRSIDVLPSTFQDHLAQVLVEAVNNAVRHGRAARIDVRLVAGASPATFTLTVDDDGVGPVQRAAGLGSALFDAMSGGEWALAARDEGGSRLRLTLRTGAMST
jgi:signal transduction histidine kinase